MKDTLRFISDIAATYRLTRLALDDRITEEAREFVYERTERDSKLAYLISCPWCISIWAGAAVFGLRKLSPELADIVSGTLAASAVTGIVYSKGLDQ